MADVGAWLERYRRTWEGADPTGVRLLFTPDATYRSVIFREPHRGREAIEAYWSRATGTQSDVDVVFGQPLLDGPRAAVEWWTTMRDAEDGDITLPGILLLSFANDGRCSALREYWHHQGGRRAPHDGWGKRSPGLTEETRRRARRWAEGYERAWRALDVEGVAALYAREAVYRSHPLREAHRGRAGVRDYTREAYAGEASVEPRFGEPLADGGTAAVEYWATMTENGDDVTLAGCVLLDFDDDGLVTSHRECWEMAGGSLRPPGEWGT